MSLSRSPLAEAIFGWRFGLAEKDRAGAKSPCIGFRGTLPGHHSSPAFPLAIRPRDCRRIAGANGLLIAREGGYATLDRTDRERGLGMLDLCSREPLTSLGPKRSRELMRTSDLPDARGTPRTGCNGLHGERLVRQRAYAKLLRLPGNLSMQPQNGTRRMSRLPRGGHRGMPATRHPKPYPQPPHLSGAKLSLLC